MVEFCFVQVVHLGYFWLHASAGVQSGACRAGQGVCMQGVEYMCMNEQESQGRLVLSLAIDGKVDTIWGPSS